MKNKLHFAVHCLAVILAITVAVRYYVSKQPLSLQKAQLLASGRVRDLWFSSPNTLIGVNSDEGVVDVQQWDLPQRQPTRSYFNIKDVIGVDEIALEYAMSPKTGELGDVQGLGATVPYAVSTDGSLIAWWWNGKLYSGPVSGDKSSIKVLPLRDVPVLAIVFSSPDRALVFFADGKVDICECGKGFMARRGTWLDGPWSIWSRGSVVAVASFSSNEAGIIEVYADDDEVEIDIRFILFPSSRGTSLAVSEKGQVVMGTEPGELHRSIPGENINNWGQPPDGGPIPAMEFYDEEHLFVLGKNRDIYLITDKGPQSIFSPVGVQSLSVSKKYLAFSMGEYIDFVELRLVRTLAGNGVDKIILHAFIVSLLGSMVVLSPVSFRVLYLRVMQGAIFILMAIVGISWFRISHTASSGDGYYEPLLSVLGHVSVLIAFLQGKSRKEPQ